MPLKKRSLVISGHSTSITLENEFWAQLQITANDQSLSIPALVAKIDKNRQPEQNLSSAIRVYVLKHVLSLKTST